MSTLNKGHVLCNVSSHNYNVLSASWIIFLFLQIWKKKVRSISVPSNAKKIITIFAVTFSTASHQINTSIMMPCEDFDRNGRGLDFWRQLLQLHLTDWEATGKDCSHNPDSGTATLQPFLTVFSDKISSYTYLQQLLCHFHPVTSAALGAKPKREAPATWSCKIDDYKVLNGHSSVFAAKCVLYGGLQMRQQPVKDLDYSSASSV